MRRDFVAEAPSLRALLGARPVRRPAQTPLTRELEQRYRRGVWLGQILFGKSYWVDDLEDGTHPRDAHAAGLDVYRRERKLLAGRPDLAAYWLLSHTLLDDAPELEETFALTRPVGHPLVVDLHARLGSATRAPRVMEKLLAKARAEEWPKGFLERLRSVVKDARSRGAGRRVPRSA